MNDEGITEEPVSISINVHPKSTTPEPENRKIDNLKVVEIAGLLETGATWMGMAASWWAMMLMQGGIFFTTVETKDCILIMLIFIFISFRHVITFSPAVKVPWVKYYSTKSVWVNIKRLRLPIGFINELSDWCKLVSAIICAVLSIMRLVSQDFCPSTVEGKSMATRNFALNAFHVLALIETLLSLLDIIVRKFIEPAINRKLYELLKEKPKAPLPKPEAKQPKPQAPPPKPEEQPKAPLPKPEAPRPKPEAPPPKPKALPPKDERKEKFTIPDEMNTDGQQKDQSNNFGVNRRKAPSIDPAGNGKQTEEKKVEAKKSQ